MLFIKYETVWFVISETIYSALLIQVTGGPKIFFYAVGMYSGTFKGLLDYGRISVSATKKLTA